MSSQNQISFPIGCSVLKPEHLKCAWVVENAAKFCIFSLSVKIRGRWAKCMSQHSKFSLGPHLRLYFWRRAAAGAERFNPFLRPVFGAVLCSIVLRVRWTELHQISGGCRHIINAPPIYFRFPMCCSTKIRLMKALVWSVAMYGCESWTCLLYTSPSPRDS